MRRPTLITAITASLVLIGLLGFWITLFGGVDGTELNPATLQRRRYVYYRIPMFNWQVTPASLDPIPSALADHLARIPSVANDPNRWVAIREYGAGGVNTGSGVILEQYLEASDGAGESVWLNWSRNFPDHAQVFWPFVTEMAAADGFELMPELFAKAAAAADTPVDRFSQELHQYCQRAYGELAADHAAANDLARASELRQLEKKHAL